MVSSVRCYSSDKPPPQLIMVHAAMLFTPAIICLNCKTNLTNRICLKLALALWNFNLAKLQHYIFWFLSFANHSWALL